jgi:hypothetical protein
MVCDSDTDELPKKSWTSPLEDEDVRQRCTRDPNLTFKDGRTDGRFKFSLAISARVFGDTKRGSLLHEKQLVTMAQEAAGPRVPPGRKSLAEVNKTALPANSLGRDCNAGVRGSQRALTSTSHDANDHWSTPSSSPGLHVWAKRTLIAVFLAQPSDGLFLEGTHKLAVDRLTPSISRAKVLDGESRL